MTTDLIPAGTWFEDALAERDPAVAARIVGEPGRLLAASVNPEVAVAVLRALAALAWRTDEVSSILARVQRWPDVPEVRRALERLQLDITAGHEYRVAYTPVLPPYMHELVAVAPFVDRERRAEVGAALRGEMLTDPGGYLALLDTLNVRCYALTTALTLRILDDVAWPRRELGALLPELRVELDRALDKLRGGFLSTLVTTGAVGAGIAGFAAGVAIDPGLAMVSGGGSALMVSSLRGKVYARFVRTPLASVLAGCGVTRACARERMTERGGRLRRFAGVAGDDNPLRLFGMVAAAAMTMEEGGTGPAWQPAW